MPRTGLNFDAAADAKSAFFNSMQAERFSRSAREHGISVETYAIVGNIQSKIVLCSIEANSHLARFSVAGDVGQRFL